MKLKNTNFLFGEPALVRENPTLFMPGFMGGGGSAAVSPVQNSLRFRAANSAYMSRTPSTPTSRTTWTVSFWVKRGALTSGQKAVFGAMPTNGSAPYDYVSFSGIATDALDFYFNSGAGVLQTAAVFRDPAAWYHVVIVADTTQAQTSGTAADSRLRMFVNGSQITSFTTATMPAQNALSAAWNVSGTQNNIGVFNNGINAFGDMLLADLTFIDGQALTPSSFGQTDTATSQWVPKTYAGTYGTNGFRLKFDDTTSTTTLGYDTSGNGNNWTLTNFSTTAGVTYDPSTDVPTNSYATLSPLVAASESSQGVAALTNANLTVAAQSNRYARTDWLLNASSRKLYYEINMTTVDSGNEYPRCGIALTSYTGTDLWAPGEVSGQGFGFRSTGKVYLNSSLLATYTAFTSGSVAMVAFDPATGKVWLGKDGTWFNSGDPAAGTGEVATITGSEWWAFVGGVAVSGSAFSINFGQRAFAHTKPTGFYTACTSDLADPAIKKPSAQFNPVLYTGTGASLSVTGVGFQPDLVWIKGRSAATDHALYDAVRGVQKQLESNTTTAETTETTGLTAFGADGFTVGSLAQVNTNTATYVAWCFKEGVTPGFDIVGFVGNGSNRTISHGLGATPHLMIVKNRTTGGYQWMVYHRNANASPATGNLYLQATSGFTTDSSIWNNTAPTSSVFSIGTNVNVNENLSSIIAYLWTEIPGFSKIGSYIGNSSSDGRFVNCGFRPAFVLIKSTAGGSEWQLYDDLRDGYNVDNDHLNPNNADTEVTDNDIDLVSNGFKLRRSSPNFNDGSTFVFAAFARAPFKYSNAR